MAYAEPVRWPRSMDEPWHRSIYAAWALCGIVAVAAWPSRGRGLCGIAAHHLLGGIINNHEDRKSLLSLQGKYKEYRSILDSLDREVSVYWQRGSFKAIRPVGDVLDRTADVVEINRDAKLIAEKLKQVSFEQVQAKVSEVRDLIKIALEVIDSKGLKEVSDPQLKNLSQGIMGLAESVEFYGLVLYRANVYVAAVARLNEAVKKIA